MCLICKQYIPGKESFTLDKIEKSIKLGTNPEHFKLLLDKILDTEMSERDEAVERSWENSKNKPNGSNLT